MKILGSSKVTATTMLEFAQNVNPDFPPVLPSLYIQIGEIYGIRGDIAFCQMLKETAYHRFGGDVKPDQYNYAGIGATGGVEGHHFEDEREGVTVHTQHLYAYASKAPLPSEEKLVDPRFKLVTRGIATEWNDLNGRWAVPGPTYGEDIERMYSEMESLQDDDLNSVIEQLRNKMQRLEKENTQLREGKAQFRAQIEDITERLKEML